MQLSDYLVKNSKKYLIFDFDETIARIELDWSKWYSGMVQIYQQYHLQAKDYSGNEHKLQNRYVKQCGPKLLKQIKYFQADFELQNTRGFTPNPELISFITSHCDYQYFLYSSNSRAVVLQGLKELQLTQYFSAVVTQDEVTYIKPDPDGFYLIYDPTVSKSEYLMIGNSHADREMAMAAGIDFYLVEYFRPIF